MIWGLIAIAIAAAAAPSRSAAQGTTADYERSDSYLARMENKVFRDSVTPRWFGNKFWYRVQTSADSYEFVLVDASAGVRRLAFDHQQLSKSLAEATSHQPEASNLKLHSISFSDDAQEFRFRFADQHWQFQVPNGPLSKSEPNVNGVENDWGLKAQQRMRRSRGGGTRTPIRIRNDLEVSLQVFWVTAEGELREYGSVDPGETFRQNTFEGHAWLCKDDAGKPVAAFVASADDDFAIVNDRTPKPLAFRGRTRRPDDADPADRPYRVEIRDFNLVLHDKHEESETILTEDGTEQHGYGGRVWWSSDFEHFVVMKTKRGLNRSIHMIRSAPKDSIHAELIKIPYVKPGDQIDHDRPVLFSRSDNWQPKLIDDKQFPSPYSLREVAWNRAG
ncbi:MAG: hypothetical protein AB8B91_20520, partial [Rubripirellula sp.]